MPEQSHIGKVKIRFWLSVKVGYLGLYSLWIRFKKSVKKWFRKIVNLAAGGIMKVPLTYLKVRLWTEMATEMPNAVVQTRMTTQIWLLEERLRTLGTRVWTNACRTREDRIKETGTCRRKMINPVLILLSTKFYIYRCDISRVDPNPIFDKRFCCKWDTWRVVPLERWDPRLECGLSNAWIKRVYSSNPLCLGRCITYSGH